ncbi:adenosylmethionine-8-amino-7-oxononanoate aminotransferase [Tenacibaculum sp. MAR_2009_124]|uniref:adenosylmethionine--8-amino-7-oxononanoate transaminase n=1 Tax=Tenacibaculum sp. MAR_2009_124 TaxID=1250059 RepID=UPI0008945F35|nr:adenosylmethionine--8-amino-7-oxononanoate transaminase [Tenacibaculum sp. MAR_2009_124]SEC94218.1 adenosylmethionine-8-amino-7-oxononanoate aminotransferase [Tenacibaculum sp. MAR_2009_124]
MKNNELLLKERDKRHLWHPLKQHKTHPNTIAIVKGKDCILTDEDGNEYIDAISSWYTSMFGHCNEYIVHKVFKQASTLDQIMFSDFTHEPAIKLAEELINILPDNQNRIFFNDNGSTAVEAALKMVLQYYSNKGIKRTTFIAFENGFHGDTFGAMGVSGLSVYNGAFKDYLIEVKRIPVPNGMNNVKVLRELNRIVSQNDIAGFIYEPLVQGAAGMKIHQAKDLELILNFLKKKNVLLIADEVMTGFGKTGKLFASDYMKTKPDIICLSKALTGGMVPLAVTSCSEEIYEAFLSDEVLKGFFHCHTYSGNPIACSAAIAVIELLQSERILNKIREITELHIGFKKRIERNKKVKKVSSLGVILTIELNSEFGYYGSLKDKISEYFMSRGVFLRPLGNTIYIQPPYVITKPQLNKVYNSIEDVINEL